MRKRGKYICLFINIKISPKETSLVVPKFALQKHGPRPSGWRVALIMKKNTVVEKSGSILFGVGK